MSAEKLGVPEHAVIKTLVMEDQDRKPLVVLMHGDLEVSTKNLTRQLGRKRVEPCAPDVAERHSGYQVGGTSPFGLRKLPPVLRRGFLVALAPAELMRITNATPLDVALER